MDQASPAAARDPVGLSGSALVVTGAGRASGRDCDSTPFLKNPKSRKFMGVQDHLAVAAAGEALKAAGLPGAPLGERAGLFLAVGYIPFEAADLDRLLEASVEDGALSLRRFSTDGLSSVNPLLTFRCLSNMPAFHISANFDLQGPYFVTYPGPGQFYNALEQARAALESDSVDAALVAASADQRNFLVSHHFSRVRHPVPAESLADAAGCLVLEKAAGAAARGARSRARLVSCSVSYEPHDPFEEAPAPSERFEGAAFEKTAADGLHLGPGSLPWALSAACAAGDGRPRDPAGKKRALRHFLESRDGFRAHSEWELEPS